MDQYQHTIYLSRYARYLEDKGRRETWEEVVDRYVQYWLDRDADPNMMERARQMILGLEVMPSMRCLMTAGKALDRDNVAGYNCAYLVVDDPRAFDEALYVLMCGTGVGFSVERQYIQKLPEVPEELHESNTTIIVADSKLGWATGYRELVALLYAGKLPKWDLSKIRPAGARLKTFGGRASGPEPLEDLFRYTVNVFQNATGRGLTSLECHDLMCKVAQAVVVGGVRRSAMISLSNFSDDRMREAKAGAWYQTDKQRSISNNSIAFTERPDFASFIKEMNHVYLSYSGERGIFNRVASKRQAARNGRRDTEHDFGTNPCSEIILRPAQFCNLTEVVVRPGDTYSTLEEKVEIATYLGTLQSTLTEFRYLRKLWKKNTEEERLLGVSLTGIMDHEVLANPYNPELPTMLEGLRGHAVLTNQKWSEKLGIPQAAAITCVKPSGTVSQLVNSASGIHARYANFYIRRIRGDVKDPMSQFLIEQGVPHEIDQTNPGAYVFSFPQRSPAGARTESTSTVYEDLDRWAVYQEHWCEHKPSITVHYQDDDWFGMLQWMWDNFDSISGIAVLPKDNHVYPQAPYEEITEEKYMELVQDMPDIDWTLFREEQDNTIGSQELACSGGVCEVNEL